MEKAARARLGLVQFLLRHDLRPLKGTRNWSVTHREWLHSLRFEKSSLRIVFQEYLHAIDEVTDRMKRIEAEIHEQATTSIHAPVIQALQTMRGVAKAYEGIAYGQALRGALIKWLGRKPTGMNSVVTIMAALSAREMIPS